MRLSPCDGVDRQLLTLGGHRYAVRFWSPEEWGLIPSADRPPDAVSFRFGWAELTPVDGAPPFLLFPYTVQG